VIASVTHEARPSIAASIGSLRAAAEARAFRP